MKVSTCLLMICTVAGFAVQIKAIPVQAQQDNSWYQREPLPQDVPEPRPDWKPSQAGLSANMYPWMEEPAKAEVSAFYCPANLNGNSFPDTSSVQLDISTLHAYDTPTDNCISDIRFVEFCYRRGSFKNLAFTFVIMNGFRGNRRVVQKVPVMAIPSADRCGHDIEYWKCCAERAIGPIWIDSTATYGVAVAPTANTLLSFAGTYVPQSLAGLSIESAVSTINQRPPTYIRQAVVRFHIKNVILQRRLLLIGK